MKLLEVEGVTKKFFELVAVDNVDLYVNSGEIVGLIGPNGSGKTTLFNCISGFLKPDGGRIIFDGKDITGKEPHEIALSGLTRTFQLIHVFGDMTVMDNMIMGIQHHQGESIVKSFFRTRSVRRKEKEARRKAEELLKFVELYRLRDEKAKNLSIGQQKLLSIAMALMSEPKMLLLDEPTASVNPVLVNRIKEYIRELSKKGITIFLIEHNMNVVMDICQRIYVLNHGQKIAEGTPEEIKMDTKVIEAYFGE